MELVKVDDLEPGKILAKPIHGADQTVLLEKGTELTPRYIRRLKKLRIRTIYVKMTDKDGFKSLSKEEIEILPQNIKKKATSTVKEALKKIDIAKQIDSNNDFDSLVDPQNILNIIDDIVTEIVNRDDLFVKFKDVMSIEDELFFHLTNVTVLSLIMGKSLGYSEERLRLLAIGAFLHDIGKIKIPPKILNKPGKLTNEEFEIIKKHTTYGYEILQDIPGIPDVSARIAYQHHERCDGSGYPKGISKRYIHKFSRIVAIADVFDAMTNDRTYRSRINVNEVIEYLYTTVSQNQLDGELIKNFLDYITPYPIGSKVKLSIGCEGVVTDVKKDNKLRPTVKVSKFKGLDEDLTIDLSKQLNIKIEKVIK